jgi:putative FmdB family regulatory protein
MGHRCRADRPLNPSAIRWINAIDRAKEGRMPIHEFDCSRCGESFEALVRSAEAAQPATCPACGSQDVTMKFSRFAARSGRLIGPTAASCGSGST